MTNIDVHALFNVLAVEIDDPANREVLATGLTEANAEAWIKMAIMRRGVGTHFYIAEPTLCEETQHGQ